VVPGAVYPVGDEAGHGQGSRLTPLHARPIEPLSDQLLAGRFHHARPDHASGCPIVHDIGDRQARTKITDQLADARLSAHLTSRPASLQVPQQANPARIVQVGQAGLDPTGSGLLIRGIQFPAGRVELAVPNLWRAAVPSQCSPRCPLSCLRSLDGGGLRTGHRVGCL
jgi:hypothetical protein